MENSILMSVKTASLLKKVLMGAGGVSALSGGSYLAGRIQQKNIMDKQNEEENAQIAQAAYEMGKSAGLARELHESFKAIPSFFKNRIMQMHMRRGLERMQTGKFSPNDLKGVGSGKINPEARALKYSRLYDKYSKAAKEDLSKTNLAVATLGVGTGLTSGVGAGIMIPKMKKEAANALMRGWQNFRKGVAAGFSRENPMMNRIESEIPTSSYHTVHKIHTENAPQYTIKTKRAPTQEQTNAAHRARTETPIHTGTSDDLVGGAPGKSPNAPPQKSRFNKYLRNVGLGAAGVGLGAAGVGFGYHQMMTPRAQE